MKREATQTDHVPYAGRRQAEAQSFRSIESASIAMPISLSSRTSSV
jgi:hypothetical protein